MIRVVVVDDHALDWSTLAPPATARTATGPSSVSRDEIISRAVRPLTEAVVRAISTRLLSVGDDQR